MSQRISVGVDRGSARRGSRWLAAAVGGLLAVSGGMAGTVGAAAAPPSPASVTDPGADKITPEVTQELSEAGRATVLIRFQDRPEMSSFAAIEDWDARGQAVYDALTRTADRSQAGVRAALDRAGTDYQTFFISNAVLVRGGDEALLTSLAADPGVEGIYLPQDYELEEPVVSEPRFAPSAVEWGIENINADDVWSEFGVDGEGIVIANIDTGVDYTHPALVNQYRGNNGDGTFDHNYNWFDAAGTGSEEPVDFEAHGTHTMGTMVGSDGGSNQIGVAPGATWIAANGCCPSDEALIISGEWMLAPTDLAGENPMPSLRPNIINNSWGSQSPSNDPFMEDVSEAWEASGIFGVWANGNIGPGCETSGSPGSRVINYSVGAYDIDNDIADFSSRGAGQDGEIKPNISAPGANVRSSVPGGGYEAFDGTSMATPHVAGAIALLWSAAPDLIGDIAYTTELLDGTAIDSPDDQCGGTDADNNVFGEGRLDALALLESAPIGDTGHVAGTVTDAATDEPLSGARASFTAERTRVATTASDGSYGLRLGSGDWDATVSKFGYLSDTGSVTVPVDETVVHDAALTPAPVGTLTGTVTDGSGQGWALYARVSVDGAPGVGAYTNPETGTYTLDLPVGTHTITATSQLPGYQAQSREVVITDGGAVEDFALIVNAITCTAPGYELALDGSTQTFDETTAPPGWSVESLISNDNVWLFEDPEGITNLTGGEGGFAVANSDVVMDEDFDTVLVSPVVDLSALSDPNLGFKSFFDSFGSGLASVEVSPDAGTTWEEIWSRSSFSDAEEISLDLSDAAAGSTQAQVRFRYQATWDLWWQVDDVFIGNRACVPTGGGLVVGYLQDDIDGAGIVGGKVTSLDHPSDSGQSRATPDDEALEDGFYWLYSELVGTHPFEASARNYGTDQQDVAVPAGDVTRADFVLGQAVLEIDPTSLETTVALGDADSREFTVTNTGTSTAELTFSELRGGFDILRADGTIMTAQDVAESSGAPLVKRDVDASFSAFAEGARPTESAALPPRTAEEPWTDLAPLPVPLLDNRVVSLDGTWYSIGGTDGFESYPSVFRYDAVALEWMPAADLPAPTQQAMAAVVDSQIVVAGGWQNGDPTSDTWIYDPGTDSWSPGAPMPTPVASMGVAVADGLAYAIGGCTTGGCFPIVDTVQAYDLGTDSWTELTAAPAEVTFPACGGLDGMIVCSGGIDSGESELDATWLFDPASDSWSPLASAPVTFWGAAAASANDQLLVVGGIQGGGVTNASWAYDLASDSWTALPNANEALYRGGGACGFARVGGDSGGFLPTDSAEMLPGYDVCGGGDVDWLSLDITEAEVAPGESVTVTVTTDSAFVNQPGAYTAGVGISANVPVRPEPVEVTMHVTPPLTWGKVMGTAYLQDCTGGLTAGDSITIDIAPVREDVGDGWVILTNQEGDYARWINTQLGTLRMTATLAGYRPDGHLVDLIRGGTVTRDFAMLDQECQENPEPVPPEVIRVAGVDRYDTAARIAQQFTAADTVFIATGAAFPDALTAAASAGSQSGPVLLVKPNWVPQVTKIELDRLQPDHVVIVGGTAAVSAEVQDTVEAFLPGATVTRHAGANRYETAALIAEDFGAADVVFVATGADYPDALAGAARAGSLDSPVLLVRADRVPSATAAQLDALAPDQIVILGGTGSISAAVATELATYAPVERVAGADRYATAAEVAQAWETSQDIFVATGQDWPDALAGAARAGATDSPLLLVKASTIPHATWAELERLDPGRIFVLGGAASINAGVLDRMRTLE